MSDLTCNSIKLILGTLKISIRFLNLKDCAISPIDLLNTDCQSLFEMLTPASSIIIHSPFLKMSFDRSSINFSMSKYILSIENVLSNVNDKVIDAYDLPLPVCPIKQIIQF